MNMDNGDLGGAIDYPYTIKLNDQDFSVHKSVGDYIVQQKMRMAEMDARIVELLRYNNEQVEKRREAERYEPEVERLMYLVGALTRERDELLQSFDMRWKADMRAIKRWQDAGGDKNTWPDHADLCVWLLDEMDKLAHDIERHMGVTNEKVRENDHLRGLVGNLKIPCVYCGLENMGECRSGFPGCARADDIMIGEDAFIRGLSEKAKRYEDALTKIKNWRRHAEVAAFAQEILDGNAPVSSDRQGPDALPGDEHKDDPGTAGSDT